MMPTALQAHLADARDAARLSRRSAHRALDRALEDPVPTATVRLIATGLIRLDDAVMALEAAARLADPLTAGPLVRRADEDRTAVAT